MFFVFCFNWYLFALLLLVIVRFLCYCDRCIVIVCCLSSCDSVCVCVCVLFVVAFASFQRKIVSGASKSLQLGICRVSGLVLIFL